MERLETSKMPEARGTKKVLFKDNPVGAARFTRFVESNRGWVTSYSTQLSGDPHTGEDIAQTVLLNIARAMDKGIYAPDTGVDNYDSAEKKERAYLGVVIHNEWINEVRKRNGSTGQRPSTIFSGDHTLLENNNTVASPEEYVVNEICLQVAMAKLSTEQQTLLHLVYIQDRSHTEIATLLDIPLGTVRSRLFAARKLLRESLLQNGVTDSSSL